MKKIILFLLFVIIGGLYSQVQRVSRISGIGRLGTVEKYAYFNGTDARLYSGNAVFNVDTVDFIVEIDFVYTLATAMIITKMVAPNGEGWRLLKANNFIRLTLQGDAVKVEPTTADDFLVAGTRYTVRFEVDFGVTAKIFVDGVEKASEDISSITGFIDNGNNFAIGSYSNGATFFEGDIYAVTVTKDGAVVAEYCFNESLTIDQSGEGITLTNANVVQLP